MSKRATRFKAEVVNGNGDVLWEVLVHDWPKRSVQFALQNHGLILRRAATGGSGPVPLVFSEHDPQASILAAREHATRRDTKLGNVLLLLLERSPDWVARAEVRRVAGDSGDRRVRELRQRNWPIEIAQLTPGVAWSVRLPQLVTAEPESVGTLFG